MNELVLSNRAAADIDEIWTFIARNNRQPAIVSEEIFVRLCMLDFPPSDVPALDSNGR